MAVSKPERETSRGPPAPDGSNSSVLSPRVFNHVIGKMIAPGVL